MGEVHLLMENEKLQHGGPNIQIPDSFPFGDNVAVARVWKSAWGGSTVSLISMSKVRPAFAKHTEGHGGPLPASPIFTPPRTP